MNAKLVVLVASLMILSGIVIFLDDAEQNDASSVTLNAMTVYDSLQTSFSYESGTQIILVDDAYEEAEYQWQGTTTFTLTGTTTRTIWMLVSGALESTLTVTFSVTTPSTYTVSISSSNTSYGTVSSGSVTVAAGTTWSSSGTTLTFSNGQTVSANVKSDTAQYDYSFNGWSPSSGTVNSNTSITANFSVSTQTYSVSIVSSNSQYGTVSNSSVTVPYGTSISSSGSTLNIGGNLIYANTKSDTAQYSYSFDGWTGASGTVTGSGKTVTANFSRTTNNYTVSIGVNQAGWGSVSNSSVTVPYGTSISSSGSTLTIGNNTIYATPTSSDQTYNYAFSSWTGASGTVTGSGKTVTANFSRTAVSYSIQAGIDDNNAGTVTIENLTQNTSNTGTDISLGANYGDQIRLSTTLATGYTFSNWYNVTTSSDDTSDNPYTFTTTGSVEYAAITIAPVQTYTVSFTAGTGGTVSANSIQNVPSGASITVSGNTVIINGSSVTAQPSAGYSFDSWSNATGTVVADRTITATFSQNTYTISAEVDNNNAGTVTLENLTQSTSNTGTDVSLTAHYGDQIRFSVSINTGYTFSHWYNVTDSIDDTSDNPHTTTVYGNLSLAAITSIQTFTVTVNAGTGGTVSANSIQNVPYNSAISTLTNSLTINGTTITAQPSAGYSFDAWSNATGNITADRTITATFSQNNYTILVGIDNNDAGTVTIENLTQNTSRTGTDVSLGANYGDQIRLTATMNPHYTFSNWYNVTTSSDYTSDNPNTATVTGSVEYAAITIAPVTYNIQAGIDNNNAGTVTIENLTQNTSRTGTDVSMTIYQGDQIRLTATMNTGYTFSHWYNVTDDLDDTSDNPYSLTPNKSIQYAAITIAPVQTYTVSFTAGTGGTVSANSIQNVPSGASITVSGNTVIINGSSVTAQPSAGYSFDSWSNATGTVVADRTITATFSQNTYTISAEVDNNNAGTVTLENLTQSTSNTGTDVSLTAHYGDQIRLTATMNSHYAFSHWYDVTDDLDDTSDNPYTITATGNIEYAAITESTYVPDVWWTNGYQNGSATVVFDFSGKTASYSHRMIIPLLTYDGIEDDADGIDEFTANGYYITLQATYKGNITITVTDPNSITYSYPSFKIGEWTQYLLTIDAQGGKIDWSGIKSPYRNKDLDFTFVNFNTIVSSTIADISDHVSDMAFQRIYHEDYGNGTVHPSFQVSSTTTFLDTYGFVMTDPTFNVIAQFPDYNDIRLNLYSFAVYGDSMTVNNYTMLMDNSQITLYYVHHRDPVYDQNHVEIVGWDEYNQAVPQGTEGAKTFKQTLTNVYITWENINSNDPDSRVCTLTFVDGGISFRMGSFPSDDLTISFGGIWYFTTALWEPYLAEETTYAMDWDSPFNLDRNGFLLIFIGGLIAILVILNIFYKPELLDYAIVVGAGVIAYILLEVI